MKRSTIKLSKRPGRGYTRDIGYVVTRSGKRGNKRFNLGRDEVQAQQAVFAIEQIWSGIEEDSRQAGTSDPVWYDVCLWVAKQIAKGKSPIDLPVRPEFWRMEDPASRAHFYALYESFMRSEFPMVAFAAADPEMLVQGKQVAADFVEAWRFPIEYQAGIAQVNPPTRPHNGQMLHAAIDAFSDWLASRHVKGANIQSGQARLLKRSVADRPLDEFGRDALHEITTYWADRPEARKIHGMTGHSISVQAVMNMLSGARRFVRWLDESDTWEWDMPKGAERLLTVKRRTLMTDKEVSDKAKGVAVWTIDELAALYKIANPIQRLLMLLGLNMGLAGAEIASLLKSEIDLTFDPPMIKRVRQKSHVYGEWPIWPETVAALQAHWATRKDKHNVAVVSSRGALLAGANSVLLVACVLVGKVVKHRLDTIDEW